MCVTGEPYLVSQRKQFPGIQLYNITNNEQQITRYDLHNLAGYAYSDIEMNMW